MSEARRFWKGDLETMAPAARARHNLGRLRTHLERVRARSGWYRRTLTAGELADQPLITKPEIIEDQSTAPPFGSLIACDPDQVVRIYVGAGPQATYMTRADYALTADNAAWAFATNGFTAADVVDNTIMYHWVIAGTVIDEGLRAIGCAVIPGGIGQPQMHVENMRWTGTTALFAFPTFLEEISARAEEMGVDPRRDLRVRIATISGEMRSDAARDRMAGFWGIDIREIYGGAEVPFMAAECGAGDGMHINPDFHVEFLHPETKVAVGPGEPCVPVVSELGREAYPMIRYWTGDISAGHHDEPCACGRTTPRLGRILGRVGDIPRVKGLFVVPRQVRAALDGAGAGLGRFQLLIDRPGRQDTLTVRVEAPAGTDAQRVASALKEGIRLTCEVELLGSEALPADAPVVVDKRRL